MQVVLDIDLDAFVSPVFHDAKDDSLVRLPDGEFIPESEEDVTRFFEKQLGLSESAPIPGAFVTHHHEVLPLWEKLVESGRLQKKFAV
jgi:hypothetical protein